MSLLLRLSAVLLALLLLAGVPASACTITGSVRFDLGTASPAALARNAVPVQRGRAGATCPSALVELLASGKLNATFNSQNNLRLRRSDGATIGYVPSADAAAQYRFTQGGNMDYVRNNLLGLLGLFGGTADIPLFVKPQAGSATAGTYTDRVTLDWSWYHCSGVVNTLGVCVLGTQTSGSGRAVIDLTLVIAEQPVAIAIRSAATWDPHNGTRNPKALPGSRLRLMLDVTNPDLLPVDGDTLRLVLPAPPGARLALEGDGASSGDAIRPEGPLAAGMQFRFGGGGDGGDDVDFSVDGGESWNYAPVAADAASQARVTHLRLRPRGPFPAQSAITLSVPFEVR